MDGVEGGIYKDAQGDGYHDANGNKIDPKDAEKLLDKHDELSRAQLGAGANDEPNPDAALKPKTPARGTAREPKVSGGAAPGGASPGASSDTSDGTGKVGDKLGEGAEKGADKTPPDVPAKKTT